MMAADLMGKPLSFTAVYAFARLFGCSLFCTTSSPVKNLLEEIFYQGFAARWEVESLVISAVRRMV